MRDIGARQRLFWLVPGSIWFSEMGLRFSVGQLSELGEDAVSDVLNAEGFLIVNRNLVFVHESSWLDLKGVGIDLPAPEPLRTPELNKLRVDRGNLSQVLKKPFPFGAVLNAEGNIGYAVRDDR